MSQPNLNEDLNIVANSNLEITYMDGDLNIIQALDDEPNDVGGLTSAELKAKFDEAGNTIKTYINGTLIPEILTEEATEAARAAAEAQREANENQRIENENARIAAEAARASSETARDTEEQARDAAEKARAEAELSRAAAEQARADENTGIVARATEQASIANSAAASASHSASEASASESSAASSASSAANSAFAASSSETAAKESEENAKSEADRAKSEADKAAAIAGGDFVKSSEKGVASGVATLGTDGKVPTGQLPAMDYVPNSEKGAASGVATLGTDGKVPTGQLPEISSVKTYTATIGTTWTENEDTGVKSQSVPITGVLAKHTAKVDHAYTGDGTSDGYAAFVEAENQYLTYITNGYAETYDGGITFYIFGDAPTVSIPIVVEVA